jgi:hypothetical protein
MPLLTVVNKMLTPLGGGPIPGTLFENPAANATVIYNAGVRTSGYYWIKGPNQPSAKYVYCDMAGQGGGWMLMMAIRGNSTQHRDNNGAVTTAVNGSQTVQMQNSTSYKWSTTDINQFMQQHGNKIFWIEPERGNVAATENSNRNIFYAPGTQSAPIWPSNLEVTQADTLYASPTTSWVNKGYGTPANAVAQTSVSTGNYTGAGHWFPMIYPDGQSFFSASTSGIRMATPYNTQNPYSDGLSGYLWLKVF